MDLEVFQNLLSKEMSRKEFLIHSGLIILTVTGIVGAIRTIKTIKNPPAVIDGSKGKEVFGGGSYGGTRKEKT